MFLILIFLSILGLIEATDRFLIIEKINQCPKCDNLPIQFIRTHVNTEFKRNKVSLNSTIEVKKKIAANLEVFVLFSRMLFYFIKKFI